ncbi:MAG TPA: phage portal protein [Candidatus Paceibacterota bacterium]
MGRFSAILARVGETFSRLDPGPVQEASYRFSSANTTRSAELTPPKESQTRRRGYEYGIQIGGTTSEAIQSAYSQERIQILTQLYQAYLTCPWVSGPVDLIARTATAGGLNVVVEDISDHDGQIPDDPPEVMRLRRMIKFCNPREDMVQLLRQTAIDLLLFGDAYIEVVYLLGEPVALYTLDATTMTVLCDEHGEVTGYRQDVDGIRSAKFDKNDVIHISLDAPRGGMYGVGPAQKALLPVTAWLFTEATIKENFRRGDPPRLHVDLGTMKDNDVQRWREMYTVNNLGPKAVGAPVITTGGGVVSVIDPRKVQDYLATSKQLRDEIISCFGTPPSKLGIIETGNIGAGTGEAQDKTFRVNTIYPVQALILEKLNYQLLQKGFGINGWHLEFGEIDMRDSEVVERIRDTRLRNGSYTLNRYRDEIGEPPVSGGDDPVLIDRQNIVMWANMDALSQAGIAYKLKGTALEPSEPSEGEPLKIEKPDVPGGSDNPALQQPPQPMQPGKFPQSPQLQPFASPGPGSGPDKAISPDARPGGPKDAAQGKAPRETRYTQDRRKLRDAWSHSYQARRRQALKEFAKVAEGVFVEDEEINPQHHDEPEYDPKELGIKGDLTTKQIDPKFVNVDHRYQRPLNPKRVEQFAKQKDKLKDHVGLLAIRADGSMWVVSGQHHTAAALEDGIPKMTYQTFRSTGWRMEKRIYENYAKWHATQHGLTKV